MADRGQFGGGHFSRSAPVHDPRPHGERAQQGTHPLTHVRGSVRIMQVRGPQSSVLSPRYCKLIVLGGIFVLAIFVFVGWAVFTEMFQQRHWRHRVESGDMDIITALLEEVLATWRRSRPPRGTSSNLWAGVQGAQLVAVALESATVSASAEGEFRTEGSERVQVVTALDEAIALASRLLDMLLYDVPNLRLDRIRVDIYSTFLMDSSGAPQQRPILSATAERHIADALTWEAMTPAEILGRFDATYERLPSGQGAIIELPPIEGQPPTPQLNPVVPDPIFED